MLSSRSVACTVVHVHFQVLGHKPRQLGADTRLLGGDGEYREQTQRHARRYRVDVDPERYPRQDHQQYAGYVDLDEVVLKETIQFEMRFDTAESSCKTCSVVIFLSCHHVHAQQAWWQPA